MKSKKKDAGFEIRGRDSIASEKLKSQTFNTFLTESSGGSNDPSTRSKGSRRSRNSRKSNRSRTSKKRGRNQNPKDDPPSYGVDF